MIDRHKKTKKRLPKKILYNHYTLILNLILEHKNEIIHENEIFRRMQNTSNGKYMTGLSYKSYTIEAIKTLTKFELVQLIHEGSKHIVQLTNYGERVIKLILQIEQYNNSYFKLLDSFYEKFLDVRFSSIIDEKSKNLDLNTRLIIEDKRNNLIGKGWSSKDLSFYNEFLSNMVDFKIVCDRNFLPMALNRYSKIVKDSGENELTLEILEYQLLRSVKKRISFISKNLENEYLGYNTKRILYPSKQEGMILYASTGGSQLLFKELCEIFYFKMIPPILKQEIEEMTYSYLNLLQPPVGNLDDYIDAIKQLVYSLEMDMKKDHKDHTKIKSNAFLFSSQFFLDLFMKYCKENNLEDQIVSLVD